jgi:hypothetical protein
MKKELVNWNDRYHREGEDSRISKMPVMNHLKALVHLQDLKIIKKLMRGLPIPNPNFSKYAFTVNKSTG